MSGKLKVGSRVLAGPFVVLGVTPIEGGMSFDLGDQPQNGAVVGYEETAAVLAEARTYVTGTARGRQSGFLLRLDALISELARPVS